VNASEITLFAKFSGPLTKRISLEADGSIRSDGSACLMARGSACRIHLTAASDLGTLIERLKPNEAIALGALRDGLSDPVQVVTKHKLNGAANVIARTGADIIYRKGQPALALLDFDTKGMPCDVTTAMVQHGSYWPALAAVLPALQTAARVMRFRRVQASFDRTPERGCQVPTGCTSTLRCKTAPTSSASSRRCMPAAGLPDSDG